MLPWRSPRMIGLSPSQIQYTCFALHIAIDNTYKNYGDLYVNTDIMDCTSECATTGFLDVISKKICLKEDMH